MKASDTFTTIISDHLNAVAAKDPLFAVSLTKENKNIDDCINYILKTVQSSGRNGFADAEIFNMAIHYYDEDDIKPVPKVSGQVMVNRTIEKQTVTPQATGPSKKVTRKTAPAPVEQTSLF